MSETRTGFYSADPVERLDAARRLIRKLAAAEARAKAAEARAKARAAQPSLPGLDAPAPLGGLHGSDRGGRR